MVYAFRPEPNDKGISSRVKRLLDAADGRDGFTRTNPFEPELCRMIRLGALLETYRQFVRDYLESVRNEPKLNDDFVAIGVVRGAYQRMFERVMDVLEDYDRIAEASATD